MKVKVRRKWKITTLEQVRQIPGLEEHFRKQEKRLSEIADFNDEAESIVDNVATLALRYGICPDFYRATFCTE